MVDTLTRGTRAVLSKDIESVMSMLVDAEMKMFDGLETPVIFLQNVVTDLILGLGANDVSRASPTTSSAATTRRPASSR